MYLLTYIRIIKFDEKHAIQFEMSKDLTRNTLRNEIKTSSFIFITK